MLRRTLLLALALGLAPAASAKDACIHTAVDGGWTFVLHKARLKPGVSAAVSGHAVADENGLNLAISGGYLVLGGTVYLGVTRYLTGSGPMGGGTTFQTTFHQIEVGLDAGGSDFAWTREVGGNVTSESGDAALVTCEGVPKLPKD